jgi:hypothetical protein
VAPQFYLATPESPAYSVRPVLHTCVYIECNLMKKKSNRRINRNESETREYSGRNEYDFAVSLLWLGFWIWLVSNIIGMINIVLGWVQ